MRLLGRNKKAIDSAFFLIMLFPVINMFFAILLKADGLLTVYIIYSLVVFLILMTTRSKRNKRAIKKSDIIVLIAMLSVTAMHLMLNYSTLPQLLVLIFAIIYWNIYSKKDVGCICLEWVLEEESKIYVIQIIYLALLAISVIYGEGVSTETWGTTTLKGPYSINHILAYEVFCYSLFDLIIWVRKNKNKALFYFVVCFTIIVLTGVRSTLIVVFIAFYFAYFTKKLSNKFFILIFGLALLGYLATNTSLFLGIVEKTQNAIALGSATSSRGTIFLSSIRALTTSKNPLYWIIGMGQDNLILYNRYHILMTIHAHNDFIDALVQYGLLGFFTYIFSLRSVCKKSVKALLIIGILAFTNGFYMYQSAVVLTPVILAFGESTKSNEY